MNKNLKIGLVLLIIASVSFLCSTVAFFILKESEKEKRLYLEKELKETIAERESIAKDLEEIKILKRDLESKLSSAQEEAKRISEELAKEKEARGLIASQLGEEKKRSDTLMADVMKEKEERLTLVHQLARAGDSYRQLKEQFDLLVEAKETLEDKLKEMMAKKGVELEKIEVRSEYQPRDIASCDEEVTSKDVKSGDVLVVNKKFDFIVSNIGRSDGADVGTGLDVYRGDELIAKTRIEKLYDKMSAAIILPEWKNSNIKEGDRVYISQ